MIASRSLLMSEATQFITICYEELGKENEISERLRIIEEEIAQKGTYTHTFTELVHGARMAWRNSNRCIGRLFWERLHILDAREANDEESVYEALLHHIEYATNKGRIRPTITIFKPYVNEENNITLHNHQLIRYAGYETENGIIGDSHSLEFTKQCEALGWKSDRTHYDVLPLMFSIDGEKPVVRSIPSHLVKEVTIEHPEYDFASLQAKWYAVPIIADMALEIGGISYYATPFNGWYMGTEIGARNLADRERYNLLPKVAEIVELNTKQKSSLWIDRATVELNVAVLHSYRQQGVTIVDHHTAAEQFKQFEELEAKAGRLVTGNWAWLIPPLTPAATHIYHKPFNNTYMKPNFFKRK